MKGPQGLEPTIARATGTYAAHREARSTPPVPSRRTTEIPWGPTGSRARSIWRLTSAVAEGSRRPLVRHPTPSATAATPGRSFQVANIAQVVANSKKTFLAAWGDQELGVDTWCCESGRASLVASCLATHRGHCHCQRSKGESTVSVRKAECPFSGPDPFSDLSDPPFFLRV